MFPLAVAILFAASATAAGDGELPFEPVQSYADAGACRARLVADVAEARGAAVATEGPYEVAAGDLRMHRVDVSEHGHRITEERCQLAALSRRSWLHEMRAEEGGDPESPYAFERVFGGR